MANNVFPSVQLDPSWFEAIPKRISSRRFDAVPVDPALLDRLNETCRRLSDAGTGARAVLLRQAPPEVFTGLVGSYGRIEGSPSAIAFVGKKEPGCEVGYLGEAIVLDAAAAGLDTCWIAAAFDAERTGTLVDLEQNERVHAITALGTAVSKIGVSERLTRTTLRARSRLPLEKTAPGHDGWPRWAREAAAAVRLAPTGANRQPCRMRMDDGSFVIGTAPKAYWTAPIDRGIAMLHAELGAAHAGVRGEWKVDAGGATFVPQAAS
jgi:nitroreductase